MFGECMPVFGPKISTDLQRLISEILAPWQSPEVWVPAASDMMLARLAAQRGGWDVHASDPAFLPAAIGSVAAGQPFRVALQPEYQDAYTFCALPEDDPPSMLASVMLGAKLAPILGKTNHYYQRQLAGYRQQWPRLHAATRAKIQATPFRLASFLIAGTYEALTQHIPADAAVVTHAGLWKVDRTLATQHAALFDWDAPDPPTDLTKKQARADALALVMQRPEWLLLLNAPDEALAPWLRGRVQASTRGVVTYLYAASQGVQRHIAPQQRIDPLLVPTLTPGKQLTGDLGLTVVSAAQFNSLRARFLSASIRPGVAPFAVVVTVGGVIIGGFAYDFDPQLSSVGAESGRIPQPAVYLLSDFAVGPTDEPRLSKLVVLAATSREAQLLAERDEGNRRRGIVTTAFTKNPVSMKYRGILELITRSEVEGTDFAGGKGWKLNYGGALGQWTLADAMKLWLEKFRV